MSIEQDPSSRDRILTAAMRQFQRKGYSGTSLKSVAAEVGVSTPALYWHFRSKEEVAYTALARSLTDFMTVVRASVVSEAPTDRLRELVTAHVTWQLDQAEVASAYAVAVGMQQMVGDLEDGHRLEITDLQRDYVQSVRDILTEGKERGVFTIEDVKLAAFAIITMCEYVNTWYNPKRELTISEVADHYAGLVLTMVGANSGR